MRSTIKHAALALALSMGAFAGACGGSAPPAETPAGGTEPGEHEAAPGKPAAAGEAATPEGGERPAEKAPEAGAPSKSTPLRATAMEADLKKIGIPLDAIPELEKLPIKQKKSVMRLFQKSLGYESCQGCHAENDFKKETRNMKVAREMWRHFVVPLRSANGGTLFCDSCHGGNEHVLDRSDKNAVKAFMEAEYEHKLTQASKAEMECSTCHGEGMETKIIEKLWKIPN